MSQITYFILGTSSMLMMIVAIIWFVYNYQRKLEQKTKEYTNIEQLMQRQELQPAYAVIQGQEDERKRIAEELHDNIGGLLATLKIYSDLNLVKEDPTDIKRLNEKISLLTDKLSEEVRKLSHEMDLRTLSGFGITVALQQLCEAVTSSGKLKCTALIELPAPLRDHVALHIYRIIQELITNTLKHAGATQSRIELNLIDQEITLIYEDNGCGFDSKTEKTGGMGLLNIRRRAELISGRLTMDSSPQGTTCILEVKND
ncbi:ATP-binding protein [Mucilaginibacter roseus]|uniref:histidine kinase n=1 Tax=Mucilaginibacter roseus TaxID=1528868 RepID=A0ABS8U1V4_9SPHI|nr:ATP-binding protein [Mucilaginibacter roseus]MCD8739832.1 ATP-binding protein [Mucilaginibacter roseus]